MAATDLSIRYQLVASLCGLKERTYKLTKRTRGQMKIHVFYWWENPLGPHSVPVCNFCLDFFSPGKLGAADWKGEAIFMKKIQNLRHTH